MSVLCVHKIPNSRLPLGILVIFEFFQRISFSFLSQGFNAMVKKGSSSLPVAPFVLITCCVFVRGTLSPPRWARIAVDGGVCVARRRVTLL